MCCLWSMGYKEVRANIHVNPVLLYSRSFSDWPSEKRHKLVVKAVEFGACLNSSNIFLLICDLHPSDQIQAETAHHT